ncbi:hypothetical protein NQ317_007769 [Molorchus minor]|uniref:Uncharacterized protein n=1 Tax=Molorchus minor TaxID=1323400 RepID=A0ABQ9JX56_9CUCU|nr:hypothetical protein NQ317_007769 [Molorchus minor]
MDIDGNIRSCCYVNCKVQTFSRSQKGQRKRSNSKKPKMEVTKELPKNVLEAAQMATSELLPEKLRDKYDLRHI